MTSWNEKDFGRTAKTTTAALALGAIVASPSTGPISASLGIDSGYVPLQQDDDGDASFDSALTPILKKQRGGSGHRVLFAPNRECKIYHPDDIIDEAPPDADLTPKPLKSTKAPTPTRQAAPVTPMARTPLDTKISEALHFLSAPVPITQTVAPQTSKATDQVKEYDVPGLGKVSKEDYDKYMWMSRMNMMQQQQEMVKKRTSDDDSDDSDDDYSDDYMRPAETIPWRAESGRRSVRRPRQFDANSRQSQRWLLSTIRRSLPKPLAYLTWKAFELDIERPDGRGTANVARAAVRKSLKRVSEKRLRRSIEKLSLKLDGLQSARGCMCILEAAHQWLCD